MCWDHGYVIEKVWQYGAGIMVFVKVVLHLVWQLKGSEIQRAFMVTS